MNEQESQSNDYLRPPLWHGKFAFGKVSLRLTLQKREVSEKDTQNFKHVSLFALDEPFEQKSPLIRRRLLVLGLYLSFLACLTGLWLTANVTGGLEHKLPSRIVNFIATQPVVVLLVPLLILLGCYFLLRLMTYEILAWPERFLDERQQMVRDRAYRNAYKFVKVACLLVPLYLCLHAALWTAQTPAPASTPVQPPTLFIDSSPNAAIKTPMFQIYSGQVDRLWLSVASTVEHQVPGSGSTYSYSFQVMASPPYEQAPTVTAPSWPNNPASLFLYYGTLLLSLLLMAFALPMSLVAWKERL